MDSLPQPLWVPQSHPAAVGCSWSTVRAPSMSLLLCLRAVLSVACCRQAQPGDAGERMSQGNPQPCGMSLGLLCPSLPASEFSPFSSPEGNHRMALSCPQWRPAPKFTCLAFLPSLSHSLLTPLLPSSLPGNASQLCTRVLVQGLLLGGPKPRPWR